MVQVRRGNAGDAAAIHELLVAAFAPYRAQYTDASFDATVLDPPRIEARMREGPVWVAESTGIVGTIAAMPDGSRLYVRGLGVHPAAQRTGVARALFDAVEEFAKGHDFAAMWLSTTTFLHASKALYLRLGFAPCEGPNDLHATPLESFEKCLRPSE